MDSVKAPAPVPVSVPHTEFIDDLANYDDLSTDRSTTSRNKHPRDPGYHRMYVGARQEGKAIGVYESTSIMGAPIRNAVSGHYMYGHKVGSREEDFYFKVVDTTHPPTSNGTHLPYHLYYESPEQWERHFGMVCRDDVKQSWKEKYDRARLRVTARI